MILIACPECARQYDVSHVPVGNRIRCLCDKVITVGSQGSLRVRALHCSHCGGAVEADEQNCRWCEAKLSDKDRRESTLCPQCFKRIEDDSRHCKSCGVAISPQALKALPEDKVCPRCKGELQIRSLGVTDVVECSACGGLWLTAHTFEAACRDAERDLDSFLLAKPKSEAPSPISDGQKQGYIPCFDCGELMHRRNFRHGQRSSGVVVDYCRGHGVWLDHEELERIVDFVRTQGGTPGSTGDGLLPYLEAGKVRPAYKSKHKYSGGKSSRGFDGTVVGALGFVLETVVDVLFD
ncbi:MAG: zinc ribbon domain-containing protein [Planctomycetota bacterium]